ncbi:hypothetical protein QRE62_20855 [Bacillus mycoides]|uniref:hypothetical protein n=1 Tax=Bacillus TaxID=1386 RepID=UPI000DC33986|nr:MULTISPECIES: hypothetical protein [Bacillus]MBJ7957993.1 hypothetical protein [Bacillus cereus group sp. N28]RAN68487.1 hypothetical protein B5P40_18390 [Bacillus sp. SRB_8]WJE62441.1 hypothetical protein QRE63_17475 [Bacillus mycoides]WJE74852.1 hypothetical protein QRE62_20855 [Bacillus mycoides]
MLMNLACALLIISGLTVVIRKTFILNHYLCNLMAFFCAYMKTSSYVLEQISLTKTILILCLLLITLILIYSHFDIRGLAFNDYTVFNLPSSGVNRLVKEGLTEANIEFTLDKNNIYLSGSPVKIRILHRPLHTTNILFRKCPENMRTEIKGIIEKKIKAEEKSFPLSGVVLIVLSIVIFFLK